MKSTIHALKPRDLRFSNTGIMTSNPARGCAVLSRTWRWIETSPWSPTN